MSYFVYIADLIGVFVFAASGAIAGRKNQMDIFGMFVLALVTGMGGGTLRSIMIGDTPPAILVDPTYVLLAGGVSVLALYAKPLWERWSRVVSFFDAIGLGIFVCAGTQIALDHGLAWWASLGMGVVTATFGGVLRDMFRAEIPLIFRKEIYATAALLGGIIYLAGVWLGLPPSYNIPISMTVTVGVRLAAIRYDIRLPGSSGD